MSNVSAVQPNTLFEPFGPSQHLDDLLDQTPRYLYRTHSPQSSGITAPTFVASTGARHNHGDILDMDVSIARDMLERHVTIWRRGPRDNFMSWTSSLLFAIQHAIRRADTDKPISSKQQVKISILDTARLPTGCFLPSVDLLEAFGVKEQPRLQFRNYYGEHLSQGRLTIPMGAMVTFTLQDLETSGLYSFYPEFDEKAAKSSLCKRVRDLREPFASDTYHHVHQLCSIQEANLAAAMAESCCSELEFRHVLFTSLLSLRPRAARDSRILQKFDQLRWSWGSIPDPLTSDPEIALLRVPEHGQFLTMLQTLRTHQKELDSIYTRVVEETKTPDTGIIEAIGRLQISSDSPTTNRGEPTLTLNLNVATSHLDPGPISALPISPTGPPNAPLKAKRAKTRRHIYINRLSSDDAQIKKAVEQITQYGLNSGPWSVSNPSVRFVYEEAVSDGVASMVVTWIRRADAQGGTTELKIVT